MNLVSLELRQWRSFAVCELEFPVGLIGVSGPNGAGKTTIAEAIGWALFGRLRAGAKVSDLRRQDAPAGERSLVRLGFRLGPTIYHVERVVNGPAKLWIGEGDEPETTRISDTNERIARELDLTWGTFQRTVFARQKDIAALDPGGSAEARKAHVERLLGLGRFRVAADKAKARAKELAHARDALREQAPDLDLLRHELVQAEEAAAAGDPTVAEATQLRALAQERAEVAEAAVDKERDRADRHGRLADEAERLKEELDERDADLKKKRERLARRAEQKAELSCLDARDLDLDALLRTRQRWELVERCAEDLATCRAERVVDFDAELAAARSAELSTVEEELEVLAEHDPSDTEALRSRVAALESVAGAPAPGPAVGRLRALDAERQAAHTRHGVLVASIEDAERHLAAVEEGGSDVPCPTCLRPYGEDHEEIAAAHRAGLAGQRSEASDLAARFSELDDKREAAAHDLQRAEAAAADLKRTDGPERLEDARRALERAEETAADRLTRVAQLRHRRDLLQQLIADDRERGRAAERAVGRLEGATDRFAVAAAALGVTDYDEAAKQVAVAAHDVAVVEHQTRQQLTAALDATVELEAEVEKLAQRRDKRSARAEQVAQELTDLALDPGALDALGASLRTSREMHEEATDALRAAELHAKERDQRAGELRRRVEDAEKVHEHLDEHARAAHEHAVVGTLLSEYRTAQHQRAWPKLEEGASRLLSDTTDGRYADVRLSQDYKLAIVDRGEEHGLERYSGGEQDLANLCLRLAIADWVSHERGVEMGFVVLDEVFGSQDEERRTRLVDELRSLGNRFHQVLVITHLPDIADLCEHQLRVEMDEPGRSAAEIVRV